MKRKKLLAGVLAVLLCGTLLPSTSAAPALSDIQGHWAQKEIEEAIASGWVDGYQDGTFKPEKTITRAEFTKMLLDATHLTPDSETVTWMKENLIQKHMLMPKKEDTPALTDMNSHWLTAQGWTDAAVCAGMVVPDDYNGKKFQPEKAIARYEIALMTDRALGLVYPASQYSGETLPFADNAEILGWMKGYVNESVKAGILQGYPDNTFRPNKTSTRAEAVIMVSRMLDEMTKGIRSDVTLTVQCVTYSVEEPASETVTGFYALDRDGILYVPARLVLQAWHDTFPYLKKPVTWSPIHQRVDTDFENFSTVQAGNEICCCDSPMLLGECVVPHHLLSAARMLYGEVMVPVYTEHPEDFPQNVHYYYYLRYTSLAPSKLVPNTWDEETKTITVQLNEPFERIS